MTDLGTEFGVEVDEHKTSNVYVFAGAVNIVERNQTGGHLVAKAGEAVRVDSRSIHHVTYEKTSTHFARTIQRQPAPVKLADDFSGDKLDRSKWWTNLWGSKGHADVIQRDGHVELINRGYLITAREFDPDRLGGIKITGRWTFVRGSPEHLQIATRSNGVPNEGFYGEVQTGLVFHTSTMNLYHYLDASGYGDVSVAEASLKRTGYITLHEGDAFDFVIVDRGRAGFSFTMTQVGNPSNTATVTGTAIGGESNHVVFYNCQYTGHEYVSYLNNVVIRSPVESPADQPAAAGTKPVKSSATNVQKGGESTSK